MIDQKNRAMPLMSREECRRRVKEVSALLDAARKSVARKIKASDAIIAWTPRSRPNHPTAGQVEVGDNTDDWLENYEFWTPLRLAKDRTPAGLIAKAFIEFNTLVVRDGINPEVAHIAFLAIDEYAQHVAPDVLGAA